MRQAVELRRCASCERWSGPRQPAEARGFVEIIGETVSGLCRGGPWDGSERRARSACGRWVVWPLLAQSG